ncbi:hypothetical protein ABFG93_21095 [Pseudalkalibacillus hwajinpoensis]|uniref:hypothetical protein n=1 Tax=Guptibacillus hwajinpoensis TaxID=208199 RepID=UPI00325C1A7E
MEFVGLIIPIVVAVFLAIDAPKHGKNPWLWGILGFLFTFLTLGIYLIKTGRKVAGWIFVALSILSIIATIALISLVIAFLTNAAGV